MGRTAARVHYNWFGDIQRLQVSGWKTTVTDTVAKFRSNGFKPADQEAVAGTLMEPNRLHDQ